ncbi:hypothetical protein [Bacteroides sp. 1001136B_160425_E2]|uniref:hypothetical protein n=1 Tax=Bacteroides sp. 1001136B_160425_E2 TaxID=2787083 RepID=UPI001E58F08E|nr:hypothetical protein [Bacteroides sp. 1001136B_160425_E2]
MHEHTKLYEQAFKTEFQNIARQVGNKSIMMAENCSYHPVVPEDASIRKVIQADTPKESWYQELKNTDPFVELVLPKMSVTTIFFKFKTN